MGLLVVAAVVGFVLLVLLPFFLSWVEDHLDASLGRVYVREALGGSSAEQAEAVIAAKLRRVVEEVQRR